MFKFFRRIRLKLLEDQPAGKAGNKFSKYLIYAIGEIILVVIGILIALQINNWNEIQKNRNEELKILKEMHNNLVSDLADCVWNIDKQRELKISNLSVLKHLDNQTPLNDSLNMHYGNLVYATTQRRNMAAYDHLKSRGIDLISNDSLRAHITKVYSERYYYIEKMELELDNPYQLNTVIPELNEKVKLDPESTFGTPLNLNSLNQDDGFKGMLRMNIKIRETMRQRYSNLKIDMENLIEHIGLELNLNT